MSDPPAAITNPDTSNTASHRAAGQGRAHLRRVGPIGDEALDPVGQLAVCPAPVEHGDVGTTPNERVDEMPAHEHRTSEHQGLPTLEAHGFRV